MLNTNINADTTETKDVINQHLLEEKFSAGLMEFEALIQSINDDNQAKLVDLLAELTEE